jgi:hypothetical protein
MDDQELDHLRARLTFLVVIQEKLETCTDDVQRGLLNAMLVLAESGATSEVIMPLVDLYSDQGTGKKRRKVALRCTLAIFSAALTALKAGRMVDDVIAEVATPNGIGRKELKNFRDRLNRGLSDEASANAYKAALSGFKKMTKAEILTHLARATLKVSDSLAFRTATGLNLVTPIAPEYCQRPGLGRWFNGARLRLLELAAFRLFLAALYLRGL